MSMPYEAKERYQAAVIAENYDGARFKSWYGKLAHGIEADALRYVINRYFNSGNTILDLPCGTGRLLPVLIERNFKVTGGDISDEMIAMARKRFQHVPNLEFFKVDAESLPFPDNSFDYVTSYRLMCHLPAEARTKVLSEMLRVAKQYVAINYHLNSLAPLAVFNWLFRRSCCATYPLSERGLRSELESQRAEICEIKKLSWYERSSALVVIRKGI